jgi:hypothetical protein
MTEITKSQTGMTVVKKTIMKLDPVSMEVVQVKPILLLDVSGSMNMHVTDRKRKIDVLRTVIDGIKIGMDMYAFSSTCHKVKYVPEPQDTTNLAGAFRYLKPQIKKDTKLTLVSDGCPDDETDALHEAIALGVPVNVVFIGTEGDDGEQFMDQLAKVTNGSRITVNEMSHNFQEQLTQGIAGYLTG